MKIAGVMALNNFPFYRIALQKLVSVCDYVYVRYDAVNGDPEILQSIKDVCAQKLRKVYVANGWNRPPEWREEMLNLINPEEPPDIVLCPDEDEVFGEELEEELRAFYFSDKDGMMFEYEPLVTDDGRKVNGGIPYPPKPHMKAFKWRKGLTYYPYHGQAIVSAYVNPASQWKAKTKIKHYCAFTRGMEAQKAWKNDVNGHKATKAVTLIGFGPSAQNNMETVGEIWSLNNCYEALRPEAMKLCTRIFELHKFEKREGYLVDDKRPHFVHLDEMGKQGRRIIMQTPHPKITNSEAYPLDEVLKVGTNYFMGTPPYMIAMAILEGYTHVRIYGLDQMDYEHVLQRECFLYWLGLAEGNGIAVDGVIPALTRHGTRRYGYDWGPEMDEEAYRLMWEGHPMEVRYKIPSRVVEGKMFNARERR